MEIILDIDAVLKGIFSQSPLPSDLKQPKALWKKGKLGNNAKTRIINQHSKDYKCILVCCKKED